MGAIMKRIGVACLLAVALCFYGGPLFAWGDKSKDEPLTLEQLLDQMKETPDFDSGTRQFSFLSDKKLSFGPYASLGISADLVDDTAKIFAFAVGVFSKLEEQPIKGKLTGFTLRVDDLERRVNAKEGDSSILIRDGKDEQVSLKSVVVSSPHRNKPLAYLIKHVPGADKVTVTIHSSEGEDYSFTLTDEQKKQIGIAWQAFRLMKDETRDYND